MFCSLQQYVGVIQAEDRRNSQKLLKDPINGGFFLVASVLFKYLMQKLKMYAGSLL